MLLFCDIDGVVLLAGEVAIGAPAREALRVFTGAGFALVLHASWRHTPAMLADGVKMFRDAGFEISGVCDPGIASRRAAISDYLIANYGNDWPRCVAVDDYEIKPLRGVQIVRIDPTHGLTPEIAHATVSVNPDAAPGLRCYGPAEGWPHLVPEQRA